MSDPDIPSRHKRFRLAAAILMDELDIDKLVIPRDHTETIAGGVQIDYDVNGDRFILTRYTTAPPPSLGNRSKQARRAAGQP